MNRDIENDGNGNTLDWHNVSHFDVNEVVEPSESLPYDLYSEKSSDLRDSRIINIFGDDGEDLVTIEDENTPDNDLDLTPKEARFLAGLLNGLTIKQSAIEAGISERSAFRYLKNEDVQRYLRDASNRVLAESERRLLLGSSKAIDVLLEILDDPDASASVRLKASIAILDNSMKHSEVTTLSTASYWLDRVSNEAELNAFGVAQTHGSDY
jgi:hypothetical protein